MKHSGQSCDIGAGRQFMVGSCCGISASIQISNFNNKLKIMHKIPN